MAGISIMSVPIFLEALRSFSISVSRAKRRLNFVVIQSRLKLVICPS